MNADFGSWLLGMSLGASALGGMLGTAGGIFIVLAATTFGSALLYAISGFGFAVLAAPLFLLFLDPARAIQLVIIISTVLSIVVLRGLLPAIAPWLLMRLALGGLIGLPLGLLAFRYADPILVRAAAGAMIFGFAILTNGGLTPSVGSTRPGHDWHQKAPTNFGSSLCARNRRSRGLKPERCGSPFLFDRVKKLEGSSSESRERTVISLGAIVWRSGNVVSPSSY